MTKNKTIYTEWTDVIVGEEPGYWTDKILGGFSRQVLGSFGIPIGFVENMAQFNCVKKNFIGEYAFIIEEHQTLDPEKAIPNITNPEENDLYWTRTFHIISFSDKNDAVMCKLYVNGEKIEEVE